MNPRTDDEPLAYRRWLRWGPGAHDWRTGTSMTVPMVAVIIVCVIGFGPAAGAIAVFGTLVSMWNPGGSLQRRLPRFAIVCPLFPASMAIGVLTSGWPWLALGAQVVLILVITTAYHHFMTGPGPGPLHLFYASCIGGYLGTTGQGWGAVGITAFASCLTAAVTLLGLFGPVVAGLVRNGLGRNGRRRPRAEAEEGSGVPGDFVTAPAVIDEDASPVFGPGAVSTGLRCSTAGMLAGAVALLLSFDHSYWAVLSATIVLHGGQDTPATVTRARHRVLGTLDGVAIVALLALTHPGPVVQLLVIVLAVWGMNVIMAWHYAVAAAFITVMTLQSNLLMLGEQATSELIIELLIATGVGVAAALIVLACSTGRARGGLSRSLRFACPILGQRQIGQKR